MNKVGVGGCGIILKNGGGGGALSNGGDGFEMGGGGDTPLRTVEFCGRQPLKNLFQETWPYLLKFFKGCLPQNLLSLLLNTLSQILFWRRLVKMECAV